jgi:hypothetical protein
MTRIMLALALVLALALASSGCGPRASVCPKWTDPDPRMADELEQHCPPDLCPHLWDWIDGQYVLKDQLEARK